MSKSLAWSARMHKQMQERLSLLEAAKKCERNCKILWLQSQINVATLEDEVNLLAEKIAKESLKGSKK